jgi:AcrR family transcriptional regulator
MRARKSRRDERKAETRAELIAAAARAFSARGYRGASMEAIAAEAGYSTGAIYGHFSGKEDLFLAVFEDYAATRARELAELEERAGGPLPKRVRVYADHWMARVRRDPSFVSLALEFLVHAARTPGLREAYAHRLAALRLTIARLLQEEAAREQLELPLPADELAIILRELGSGLALAKLADPEAFRDGLYGDFVELLFTLLRDRVPATGGGGVPRTVRAD